MLDLVGDGGRKFLAGGGCVGAEELGMGVEKEKGGSGGSARNERADGYSGMHQAASGDDFGFARDYASAESAAEEITDGARIFRAEEIFQNASFFCGWDKNFYYRRIRTKNVAVTLERQNAGGKILQNGF